MIPPVASDGKRGGSRQRASATLTTLVDNRAGERCGSEHGFSAWVEAAGGPVLFDTGQGGLLEGNAAAPGGRPPVWS